MFFRSFIVPSVRPSVPLSVRPFVRPSVCPSILCPGYNFILHKWISIWTEVFGISRRRVGQKNHTLKGQGHTGSSNVKMQPFVTGL